MIVLIPIIALIIGAALGNRFDFISLRGANAQYLAVACLAGLDTVCGGIRSGLEGKFRNDVFYTGFLTNCLIAFFLAWLGDQIYINLFLAVALVLGGRLFTNLSLIRRYLLTRIQDATERKRLQAAQPSAASETNS